MKKLPTISVIVPFFNCENYLREALDSILKQNYKLLDIIAIDDGSTDQSLQIAESYLSQIRILTQTNQGAAKARNHGIEKARGRFLAFLDADDIWMSNKLSSQMTVFNEHPELDMVFGGVEQFISPDIKARKQFKLDNTNQVLPGYVPGTLLIRKTSFIKVGLFDPAWRVGEFIDWCAKAIELGLKSLILPEIVMKRRIHSTNLGIISKDARSDYVKIVKASLDRKRSKMA